MVRPLSAAAAAHQTIERAPITPLPPRCRCGRGNVSSPQDLLFGARDVQQSHGKSRRRWHSSRPSALEPDSNRRCAPRIVATVGNTGRHLASSGRHHRNPAVVPTLSSNSTRPLVIQSEAVGPVDSQIHEDRRQHRKVLTWQLTQIRKGDSSSDSQALEVWAAIEGWAGLGTGCSLVERQRRSTENYAG